MEPKGVLKLYPEVCYESLEMLFWEFQSYQKHIEFLNMTAFFFLTLKGLWKGKGEVHVDSFKML